MGRGPGIRVVGTDSVQIDFRWRGERRRERLRLAPTKANLQFAKRLKAVIEHEIAIGTFEYAKHFPKSARARVSVGTPLRVSLLAYADSLASELEPETVKKYRLDAQSVAGWFAPDVTLQTLTRALVRQAVGKLELSKKRILNLLTPLRGAVSQAFEDGDLKANPLDKLKIRRVRLASKDRPNPFNPDEVARLATTPLGYMWQAWAWSGLRPGEIVGLEPGDIDLVAGRVHIRRSVRVGRTKAPKTSAGERTVELLPNARAGFERALADGKPCVFWNPNTGERWYEDRAIARAFRIACKAVGVPYRGPKHLRHTYASWALSAGENPMWVAKQMGHKDTAVLFRVYAQWIPSVDAHAGQRMVAKAG